MNTFKKNIKWFSLLELMIVIFIMWILFLLWRWWFTTKNKSFYYAQSCVNYIYWDVNYFLNSAFVSRGIKSWDFVTFPDEYIIKFDWNSNKIFFNYKYWPEIITWYTLVISWWTNWYHCNGIGYSVVLSWGSNLFIKKNINNSDWVWFLFEKNVWHRDITWSIVFYYCNNSFCKDLAMFVVDSRKKNITRRFCWIYTWINNTKCISRY